MATQPPSTQTTPESRSAFGLANALAYKFGYRHTEAATAVENYAADAGKFSLANSGLLAAPACKLLVINGMEDSIYPIEDSILAATQGTGKDLVPRGDRRHMGNPGAEEIIYAWFDEARDCPPYRPEPDDTVTRH